VLVNRAAAGATPAVKQSADGVPALVGTGQQVPLLPSGTAPYCNLDHAASTAPLVAVRDAVERFLGWYSSVHRGAGFKSQVASAAYEGARHAVALFVGARLDDVVIFTRNTTDSTNLLATCLPPGRQVLAFAFEHHANLLPWRRHILHQLTVPTSPGDLLTQLEAALRARKTDLVVMSGASNVTGELTPLGEIASLCHSHGARLLVDAAQLAPHRPINMETDDLDYVAFSGHKLYAPYGAGALIGRADWLDRGRPYLEGGGAVELVTLDDVLWKAGPERHEAGSPNVVGAVALGAACQTLSGYGVPRLAEAEAALHDYARSRLQEIPGLRLYSIWPFEHPHIGVLTFNLDGFHYSLLAAILSAEHGIGVRDGCFCAHPLMVHLLGIEPDEVRRLHREVARGNRSEIPGAVRASLGLDTTRHDVDRLVDAMARISAEGPRWTYRQPAGATSYVPAPDPRPWPPMPEGILLQP
jgi:selenocysteine lyase/cysteine desulfurase